MLVYRDSLALLVVVLVVLVLVVLVVVMGVEPVLLLLVTPLMGYWQPIIPPMSRGCSISGIGIPNARSSFTKGVVFSR
jgi:hypothetical protein